MLLRCDFRVSFVQYLNHVRHTLPFAVQPRPCGELQHATRVGGSDQRRASGFDALHLVLEDLHRKIVVNDVVDAGATAAYVGSGHFSIDQAGDRT